MDIIKCHRCHRELPETHFYVNRSKKNGLHSWCKDCVRQYDHNKRLQHKKTSPSSTTNCQRIMPIPPLSMDAIYRIIQTSNCVMKFANVGTQL